jgi:hypothetical protein
MPSKAKPSGHVLTGEPLVDRVFIQVVQIP